MRPSEVFQGGAVIETDDERATSEYALDRNNPRYHELSLILERDPPIEATGDEAEVIMQGLRKTLENDLRPGRAGFQKLLEDFEVAIG